MSNFFTLGSKWIGIYCVALADRRVIQGFSFYIHLRSAASTITASFPGVAQAIIAKSDRNSDDRDLFDTGCIMHLRFCLSQ